MNIQAWKYVKPLEDEKAIEEFEKKNDIQFPDDLKEILKKYNGGRPPLRLFDTVGERNREFKTLLSFNRTDVENIYKIYPLDSEIENMVPFASDPAGNYFVLKDGKIFLWNHESDSVLFLADSITEFLRSLHE